MKLRHFQIIWLNSDGETVQKSPVKLDDSVGMLTLYNTLRNFSTGFGVNFKIGDSILIKEVE